MMQIRYRGDGKQGRGKPTALPASPRTKLLDPQDYIADPGLADAVNVCLLLGQPLLLTGEPGTGKTQLAYSLAWELGLNVLKFETKSTSRARDLFYSYDSLGRFQTAQFKEGSRNPVAYVTYNALGTAILHANKKARYAKLLPEGFVNKEEARSVVLIDEVDKAPRDFPNDILNELEGMYFRLVELGNAKIEAPLEMKPIVVITSNSEKGLPDAFLRRCVYYNVPFPKPKRLMLILEKRLGHYSRRSSQFLSDALDIFYLLRDPASNLRKKPATAELLDWLLILNEISGDSQNVLAETSEIALRTLSTLVKTASDQEQAQKVVGQWKSSK